MASFERWANSERDSNDWYWRFRFWRVELQMVVRRHRYPENPNLINKTYIHGDRWVFHPHLIYDRKSRPKPKPTKSHYEHQVDEMSKGVAKIRDQEAKELFKPKTKRVK